MNTFLEIFNETSTWEELSKAEREKGLQHLESILLEDTEASDNLHALLRSLLWQANEDAVDMIPPVEPTEDEVDALIAAFLLIDYELEYTAETGVFNIIMPE